MRTLHLGLRVSDLGRSLAFYTTLGYEVVGEVPETDLGHLTMIELPGGRVRRHRTGPRGGPTSGRRQPPQPPRHPGPVDGRDAVRPRHERHRCRAPDLARRVRGLPDDVDRGPRRRSAAEAGPVARRPRRGHELPPTSRRPNDRWLGRPQTSGVRCRSRRSGATWCASRSGSKDPEDIIWDLDQALSAAGQGPNMTVATWSPPTARQRLAILRATPNRSPCSACPPIQPGQLLRGDLPALVELLVRRCVVRESEGRRGPRPAGVPVARRAATCARLGRRVPSHRGPAERGRRGRRHSRHPDVLGPARSALRRRPIASSRIPAATP